jgi:DNA-binding CsgD family transcriptional regulator
VHGPDPAGPQSERDRGGFYRPRGVAAATAGDALALLYDLTPAETRVFQLLAGGKTQAAVAAQLGIASSTVKTHLLKVFEKTGISRQAELVRLAASLSLPL